MNRRTFTSSCLSCLGASLMLPLLDSCQSVHYTNGIVENNGLRIPRSEFTYVKNGQTITREYLVIRNESMEFPIYLYKTGQSEYSALLMKCTHQGNELQASGDHLHCTAHGSEFNNKGKVVQGPAETNLRAFPVTESGGSVFIDLRS